MANQVLVNVKTPKESGKLRFRNQPE